MEKDKIIVDGVISIHALREEGDGCKNSKANACNYFYPRPPRGGRRIGSRPPT